MVLVCPACQKEVPGGAARRSGGPFLLSAGSLQPPRRSRCSSPSSIKTGMWLAVLASRLPGGPATSFECVSMINVLATVSDLD